MNATTSAGDGRLTPGTCIPGPNESRTKRIHTTTTTRNPNTGGQSPRLPWCWEIKLTPWSGWIHRNLLEYISFVICCIYLLVCNGIHFIPSQTNVRLSLYNTWTYRRPHQPQSQKNPPNFQSCKTPNRQGRLWGGRHPWCTRLPIFRPNYPWLGLNPKDGQVKKASQGSLNTCKCPWQRPQLTFALGQDNNIADRMLVPDSECRIWKLDLFIKVRDYWLPFVE